MSDDRNTIRPDAAALRALAHPLRVRLLAALRRDGPATSAALARAFDETTGATSYHLRQLARHGFVEEETGRGTARERWWRALHRYTSWDTADFLDDPAAMEAGTVMLHRQLDVENDHVREWIAHQADWPRAWLAAADASDLALRLTPARLARLVSEVHEVVMRYETPDTGDIPDVADDAETRDVMVYFRAFPIRRET